jgi:hypothetical protein
MNYLFGLPVLITSIKSTEYDKKHIIDTIKSNYKKDNIRDAWDKSFFKTDIHHSLLDENNNNFKKINYDSLIKPYEKVIQEYIKGLSPRGPANISYQIVNYTASKDKTFMKPHMHSDCELSMVHYVQFDKEHEPTTFQSPYFYTGIWERNKNFDGVLHGGELNNSWLQNEWQFPVKENDVIIFPAVLKHYVRNVESKRLRITISANINVNKA